MTWNEKAPADWTKEEADRFTEHRRLLGYFEGRVRDGIGSVSPICQQVGPGVSGTDNRCGNIVVNDHNRQIIAVVPGKWGEPSIKKYATVETTTFEPNPGAHENLRILLERACAAPLLIDEIDYMRQEVYRLRKERDSLKEVIAQGK